MNFTFFDDCCGELIFIFVLLSITLKIFIQISEDDQYIYCGTTSGDILQVSETVMKLYFSVNLKNDVFND